MLKGSSTIESLYGCKFVDVGRTDPAKYLQPIPKPPTARKMSGVVDKIVPGAASSVAIVKTKSGEEVAAVIDAGSTAPAIGTNVSVETVGLVARLLKR
jgi:hypothetical protein